MEELNRAAEELRLSPESSMPSGYNIHEWRAICLSKASRLEDQASKAAESMRTAPEGNWVKRSDGEFEFVSSFTEKEDETPDRAKIIAVIEETEELLAKLKRGIAKTKKRRREARAKSKSTHKLTAMISQMRKTCNTYEADLAKLDRELDEALKTAPKTEPEYIVRNGELFYAKDPTKQPEYIIRKGRKYYITGTINLKSL